MRPRGNDFTAKKNVLFTLKQLPKSAQFITQPHSDKRDHVIWQDPGEKIRPFKVMARFEDENEDKIKGDLKSQISTSLAKGMASLLCQQRLETQTAEDLSLNSRILV